MEIVKEFLEQQVVALTKERQQHLSDSLRCDGAILTCTQLIKRLATPEPAPTPKKSPSKTP